MTNMQLCFAIGLPCVTIIASLIIFLLRQTLYSSSIGLANRGDSGVWGALCLTVPAIGVGDSWLR
jgi:hypothetical protein